MEPIEDVNKELDRIAPGFPPKQHMDPPEGYFDALPDRILNRWHRKASQQVWKLITRQWIGIAAIVTGLIIGGWWFFNRPSNEASSEITSIEAYQYIHENIDEFESLIESSEDVMDRVSDEPSGLSEDAVEEYL